MSRVVDRCRECRCGLMSLLLLMLLFLPAPMVMTRDLSVEPLRFLRSNYSFQLPSDLPEGSVLGAVSASVTPWSLCHPSSLNFSLLPPEDNLETLPFDLDSSLGLLRLSAAWKPGLATPGSIYRFDVRAVCVETNTSQGSKGAVDLSTNQSTSRVTLSNSVTIEVTSALGQLAESEDYVSAVCWSATLEFSVLENTAPVLLAAFRTNFSSSSGTLHLAYHLHGDEEVLALFSLDENATLWLIEPLDREDNSEINATITCSVNGGNASQQTMTISVLDVGDNPPVFLQTGSQSLLLAVSSRMASSSVFVELEDRDLTTPDTYEVFFPDGKDSAIYLEKLLVNGSRLKAELRLNSTSGLNWPPSTTIGFRDTDFRNLREWRLETDNSNFSAHQDDKIWKDVALLTLRTVDTRPWTSTSHVTRTASRFTRLTTLSNVFEGLSNFSLDSPGSEDWSFIFNVTPNTGIVYVDNKTALEDLQEDTVLLSVMSQSNGLLVPIQITVRVEGTKSNYSECDKACARVGRQEWCERTCGAGAREGLCVWTSFTPASSSYGFQSCSPTPSHGPCPDLHCDELELLDPDAICPQDCAEMVLARGQINLATGLGIKWATPDNPCLCYKGRTCACMPLSRLRPPDLSPHPGASASLDHVIFPEDFSLKGEMGPANLSTSSTPRAGKLSRQISCGPACIATLAVTISGFTLFAVTLTWWLPRRRRRRRQRWHSGDVDSVNNVLSMTAINTLYCTATNHFAPNDCAMTEPSAAMIEPDSHWEFPRSRLILEQSLGEGEFGRVIKARAVGIRDRRYCSKVAVKMLKPGAIQAELEDLKSEFTLLKEVNHQNVIRLLGVCTVDGPFYLIVEYCRHGCLLSLLRQAKDRELQGWAEKERLRGSASSRQPVAIPSSRDILSLAWQIARGMEYLATMKLVHRDLAARNVLVAGGMQIKISDFGLSRDVYESDVYFKLSKGRVPVKWMAPESLYEETYTTKSDIWSFGITLWEIVTMGANPYPGVMPERLFTLLKDGFRMDKPQHCSDKIHTIMQACWQQEPDRRPTFFELVQLLDSMLQRHTDYMDLTADPSFEHSHDLHPDGPDTSPSGTDSEDCECLIATLIQDTLADSDDDDVLISELQPTQLQGSHRNGTLPSREQSRLNGLQHGVRVNGMGNGHSRV